MTCFLCWETAVRFTPCEKTRKLLANAKKVSNAIAAMFCGSELDETNSFLPRSKK
jgi:hypothetical protein